MAIAMSVSTVVAFYAIVDFLQVLFPPAKVGRSRTGVMSSPFSDS